MRLWLGPLLGRVLSWERVSPWRQSGSALSFGLPPWTGSDCVSGSGSWACHPEDWSGGSLGLWPGGWLLHPVMWDQVVWFLSPTLLICAEGVLSGERAGLPGTLAGTRGARKRHHWWEVPSPGWPGGLQSWREAFPVSGAAQASE